MTNSPKTEKPTKPLAKKILIIISKPLLWLFSDMGKPMSAKQWLYGILFMIAVTALFELF